MKKREPELQIFRPDFTSPRALPLFLAEVEAGFPSPAEDYIDKKLDLNQLLIPHPASTFFVKVSGYSMIGARIQPGDILVVDRSLEAVDKKIVIAVVEGEFTVKRIRIQEGKTALIPENKEYQPIILTEESDVTIWGIVTSVIHQFS